MTTGAKITEEVSSTISNIFQVFWDMCIARYDERFLYFSEMTHVKNDFWYVGSCNFTDNIRNKRRRKRFWKRFCEISSSASEADFCNTSDDEDAERLQVLLDGAYNYSPSLFKYLSVDPVHRKSLLFFDKDLYEHESNSSCENDISSSPGCTNGCATEEDSQGPATEDDDPV